MKKLLVLFYCAIAISANATTYYVSASGSDANNGLASTTAFASLYKASSVVSSGDSISFVGSSSYTESHQCIVPTGVSIDFNYSTIHLSYYNNSFYQASIMFSSTKEGTNGNQNIWRGNFEGNNFTSFQGILVRCRNHVNFYNCTFANFQVSGLHIAGKINENTGTPPSSFTKGCGVYNCRFTDCNDRVIQSSSGVACGSITAEGTDSLTLKYDTLININKAQTHNGDLFCSVQGNNKNTIFSNCFMQKPADEGTAFNFCIEDWYDMGGCVIEYCTFKGGGNHIDIAQGGAYRGASQYSWIIHDNYFYSDNLLTSSGSQPTWSFAIQLESSTDAQWAPQNPRNGDMLIYNNHCKKIGSLLYIDLTRYSNDFIRNIVVHNNLCDSMGYANNTYGAIVNVLMNKGVSIDSLFIDNNTFVSLTGTGGTQAGVILEPDSGRFSNIYFRNNIVENFSTYGYFAFRGSHACDSVYLQKNITYSNAYSNSYHIFSGVPAPTNLTNSGNLTSNPLLNINYYLTSGSPAIGAALNVGFGIDIGAFPYGSTNISPKANAGQDQTITLPTNSVTLTGSGTDSDGVVTTYQWAQISGPASSSISSSSTSNTIVSGLVQGVYQYQLTVTDNLGATGKDTVQVTVTPAPNQPPVANAGPDQTITLPINSVTLTGSGTDPDGTVVSYQWTKISGPVSYSITDTTLPTATVTGLVQGTYQFQLQVTDNSGATATDVILITVNPATNQPPAANAGSNQAITLPVNSVTLSGSGTDADGTIVTYLWTELSGPSLATIVSINSATTNVSALIQGTYQFQLTVIDNDGAIGTATVQVTVNPAINIPPVANAGNNQSIALPVNSVILSGTGTDSDGTVVSYEWTELSGPSAYTIVTPSSATTSITDLVQGIYQFQLQVTDNEGAVGISTVQVTVNSVADIPPVANAGPNQSITLPINTVTLNGSGTDSDGTVVSYQWTELSGPSAYTIVTPSSATTSITDLVQGIYQFQLQVTDNAGATGVAIVQITVNAAANIPPVANAGTDQTINLPTDSVTLSGSGTDADGAIVAYQWAELSGPASYNINNPGSAITNVTGLVAGTYQFQLQVTDNDGATGIAIIQITVNPAANIPPVANAGNNQTITLPTNSVTLSGSGTDADGTVASYLWTKISGPSSYSIASPNTAATSVSGLAQGTYQFQLQVTDNLGATGTAIVQVVVNSATNIPPVANAGSNQTITLPVDSVTLSGSGTDADGTVVSYKWTKTSGPSSYTIVNTNSASTSVSGLVAGTYKFQLTVTDNSGATNSGSVKITVKNASNIPPVADAGSDQAITLPANSVTLSGTGTDADGIVVAYQWTKISGPSSYTIVNSNAATTNVTGLVQGTYKFQLTVTDNKGAVGTSTVLVTVNAPVNQPPVVNAGTDQTITLPADSTTLSGSGTDPDGTITSYQWTEISGPASYSITNSDSAITSITGLVQGIYQFQLTVTDNNGATGTATIQITVNPAANIPPVANAGAGQVITLPINSVTVTGTGTDADGTIVAYQWTEISGPSSFNIVDQNSPSTNITGLVAGIYQFQLQVTDNNGAVGAAVVQITVNPAPNIPPVANAGSDQTITLPADSVTLNGSGTDADGTIVAYQWTEISGPSASLIAFANSDLTEVNGLLEGTYEFQLQVTDNSGAVSMDTMMVTVNPAANILPVANAGSSQTITLPLNSVMLNGSGTDADGTIAGYQWTQISGPANSTIVNSNSANTNVTGLVQGVYQFQLQVTDNSGGTGTAVVQVTVNPAVNIPPVANAGSDQSITLPTSTVTLGGSGTDADGTIVSYQWTKISGAGTYNIVNTNSAITDVTNLVQGVYQFQLTVTDDKGAIGTDIVQVIVNPAPNQPPVANAGPDQSITLPQDSAVLNGSGTDADGTIVSYQWTKISGPSAYTIVNVNSATANVTGLVQGTYQFQLRVTDNNGAIGTDVVQITVNPAPNQPPTANAGSDQTITLPVNSVTLTGSGTDADGTIASYQWTELSGPSTGVITNAAASTTAANNLVQGTYKFQLQVTDNDGATANAVVQVIVKPAPNQPPVANAGADQTITLPAGTVTLTGSGTDADGTIVAYQWTEISGPASFNINSANAAVTAVTGLVAGTYQFQLMVTDNSGAIATDIVQIIVNPAPNVPPVANAGPDEIITLPANSITLNGSGTDADGTIVSYQWTKVSGPSSYSITNANSATVNITGLVQGIYQFQLEVTDNNGAKSDDVMKLTVNPAANIPPVANAGPDKVITLPANTVTLIGSGTDADGSVIGYQWTKISGPSAYYISNSTSSSTDIDGLAQGVYLFELRVTDNNGARGRDTVQVTVNPAPNVPPVAYAGADQIITLPANSVSLTGSGTDADGTIVSYQWTKISGPSSYTIINPTSPVTDAWGLTQGVYQFVLTITDNNGATGSDTVQVTVLQFVNTLLTADAGPDQTITLPQDSITLAGSGTNSGGSIVSYNWMQISGPSSGNILSPGHANTTVSGLIGGNYQFELTVTDNLGQVAKDTMAVVVTEPRLSTIAVNNVKVFPNPVIDVATLQITTLQLYPKLLITISDVYGNIVYNNEIKPSATNITRQLNLSNLSKGTYVIVVNYGNNQKQSLKILRL